LARSKSLTTSWAHAAAAVLLVGVLAGLAGCEWLWPSQQWTGDIASSPLDRDTDPDVPAGDVAALVAGNTAFAFDLLHELTPDAANLIYSPFSISAALTITYAGAVGATKAQMASALHFGLEQGTIHAVFNYLDLELHDRTGLGYPYPDDDFELNVVNAAWGQRGYTFKSKYLDVLAVNYGAGLHLLDFEGDPDGSREMINDWVSQQTDDRIPDLLPPASVDHATRLVLTNACYFTASWLYPFDPGQTGLGSFEPLDGDRVYVPMMRQRRSLDYASWDGGQAVELPYCAPQLSMLLLVPDQGTFEAFEAGLDVARYENILSSLEPRLITLLMPRFEASYDASLVDPLIALGMEDPFVGGIADFSDIDGTHNLYISDVAHKSWITVDEAGTEAAAATSVIMPPVSHGDPLPLTINRPFLFVIRDIPTNTILFLGRIVEIAD